MSKMNELSQVIDELIACGENLISTANNLKEFFSSTAEEESKAPIEETATPADNPVSSAVATTTPETEASIKTYEFADVRKAFLAKSNAEHTPQLKALITKYGASRLSDIKKDMYPALMADLEAIGCANTHA